MSRPAVAISGNKGASESRLETGRETNDKFRFLNHTADLAMECFGEDLEELLINGAKGMFRAIVEEMPPGNPAEQLIEVAGDSPDTLFLSWLRELLFIYDTQRFIPLIFRIEISDARKASAVLAGRTVSDEVMLPGPIKAATYHGLKVEKTTSGGWKAHVVFDT